MVQMGCGTRGTVLDAGDVRSKMEEGKYRIKLPDVSPGGELHSILKSVVEFERWQDEVHVRASRVGPIGSSRRKQVSPTDRQDRKDPHPDKRKPRDGGRKSSDEGIKPTSTRASGGTDLAKPSPPPKPACNDPFKKYTMCSYDERSNSATPKVKQTNICLPYFSRRVPRASRGDRTSWCAMLIY